MLNENVDSPAPAEHNFQDLGIPKHVFYTDSVVLEYGGIERGDFKLIIKGDDKNFTFKFDEMLSDPFPPLVKFFNAIKAGQPYEIILTGEEYYRPPLIKISVKKRYDGNLQFCVELIHEKVILIEHLQREELLAKFENIFNSLLNDEYFPYAYPCFWCCVDSEDFDIVAEKFKAEDPSLTTNQLMKKAFTEGGLSLLPKYQEHLKRYKKMLSEYIVPETWG